MANADQTIFLWLNGLAGQFIIFDRAVSWLASDYLIPAGLSLTLMGLWFVGRDKEARQRHQIGLFAALTSMALSSLGVFIVNAFYFRPRPFDTLDNLTLLFYQPTDSSFPANSAAATFGMAAVVWSINKPVGTAMLIGAGLYGVARVIAGVHYPFDIIAGALIGMVVAFLALKLRDLLSPILTIVIRAARMLCLA